MPDYPTPPSDSSTFDDDSAAYDVEEIRETLHRLSAIPRSELPDGPDRDALARLIEMGFVEYIYRPHGARFHNIWWRRTIPGVPPRERVSDWLSARRDMERQP